MKNTLLDSLIEHKTRPDRKMIEIKFEKKLRILGILFVSLSLKLYCLARQPSGWERSRRSWFIRLKCSRTDRYSRQEKWEGLTVFYTKPHTSSFWPRGRSLPGLGEKKEKVKLFQFVWCREWFTCTLCMNITIFFPRKTCLLPVKSSNKSRLCFLSHEILQLDSKYTPPYLLLLPVG